MCYLDGCIDIKDPHLRGMRVLSQIQQSAGASTTHPKHDIKISQVYCWSKENRFK